MPKAVWPLLFQFKWADVSLIWSRYFVVKVRWSKILWCWGHLHLLALPVEIKPEVKIISHSSHFAFCNFWALIDLCFLDQLIFSFPKWLVSTRSAIWRFLLARINTFFTCIEQLISPSHNCSPQEYLFIYMSKTAMLRKSDKVQGIKYVVVKP